MTDPYINEITLAGRLAEAPDRRPLATGGEVVAWRLIVDRPRAEGRRRVVDTFPCATFEQDVGDRATGWEPGDMIEVHGSLRRRFWGTQDRLSRFEVEVYAATLLSPVPPEPPPRTPTPRP